MVSNLKKKCQGLPVGNYWYPESNFSVEGFVENPQENPLNFQKNRSKSLKIGKIPLKSSADFLFDNPLNTEQLQLSAPRFGLEMNIMAYDLNKL